MERNREARRVTIPAANNGVPRRRHRTGGSSRDSPDEDGLGEQQDMMMPRLRDRGLKKDSGRDRERERERFTRSKRRRHGSNKDDVRDDSSDESVNEEDDEYDEDVQGSVRMLPPNPAQTINNHHRKILNKNLRAPPLKPADEMIGVSVPRKARSAMTKRAHEWNSGGGGGGGIGGDIIHRQESASPVRPYQAAPVSPSSSNASARKKMKANRSKSRPPKSSKPSPSASTNPEELEIEIAEVLYGLRTQPQPQGPSVKESASSDTAKIDSKEVDKTSSDAKSATSSPCSNNPSVFPHSSPLYTQNSSSSGAPISAVAPKRKRPRQVSENIGNFSSRTTKTEIDQHPKAEFSSASLEKILGAPAENSGLSPAPASVSASESLPQQETKAEVNAVSESNPSAEEGRDQSFSMSTMKEVTSEKESPPVGLAVDHQDVTATTVGTNVMDIESQKDENFQIDLTAPQFRSSPDREDVIHLAAAGSSSLKVSSIVDAEMTDKGGDVGLNISTGEAVNAGSKEKEKGKAIIQEDVDSRDLVLNNESVSDLKLMQRLDGDGNMGSDIGSKLLQEIPKLSLHPANVAGDEQKKEKAALPNSFPLSMAVASWPGGLPPLGYMAPMQGLVSMDGSTIPSTPIQPFFTPRVKRCTTHHYICQNIQYIQQLMKTGAVGSAPLFGAKPCNFNVIPPAEFNGNITGRSMSSLQDMGQQIITIFPGNSEKDNSVLQNDQRKQQPVLLQPGVPPNNILHGPAYIFPYNQQQAVAAAAAARPVLTKPPSNTVNLSSNSVTASGSTTATTSSATTMSFNYPNISPSEAQYLAIFQNSGYPFPLAAPPNYRGTHPQAMPLFNGSFYPSQMIHPSQLQQSQPQLQQSSGSSLSQKHLQGQQHQMSQGSLVNGGSGLGTFQNFPPPKTRSQPQQQNHPLSGRDVEVGSKDNNTPSTTDSRVSLSSHAPVYGQNFAMSIHPMSFAMVNPSGGGGNQNEKKQQQPQQHTASKIGPESHAPQTFAMSFAPPNSSDISSQERKGGQAVKSPPSIAFSRSEVADVSGGSDSPRNVNAAATDFSAHSVNAVPGTFNISSSHLSPLYQNQKLDQQQLIKLNKLQQHHLDQQHAIAAAATRSKTLAPANGGTYPEHAKFQDVLANFPQPYEQKNTSTSGSSPSPQWKNSSTSKTPNPRVPSALSSSTTPSLKTHVQNQARHQQISFGSPQKPSVVAQTNNNPSPLSTAVSSPTHSSVSRGTSGSPRSITTYTSNKTSQTSSAQTQKPSILGNPPNIAAAAAAAATSSAGIKSQMQQQQQQQTQQFSKQAMQQAQQLFFSNHNYVQQPQGGPHSMGSTVSASSGYYLQRKRPEQQQQQTQQPQSSTATMLLCPVSGTGSGSSDPAKTVVGVSPTKGHSASNMQQLLPAGFSYVNTVQAGVHAKPPEQKQPAA